METNGEEISQLLSLILTCKNMDIHNIYASVAYSLFVEILSILMCTLIPTFTFVNVILEMVGRLHFHSSFTEVYVA